MKKLILLVFIACFTGSHMHGQVLKRLADRARQKLENKAGDKVDKGIDDAVDKKKTEPKNGSSPGSSNDGNSSNTADNGGSGAVSASGATGNGDGATSTAAPVSLKTYSRYDFVPGDKMLVYENFTQDAIGDFPGKWNTNSSGEVVTLSNKEGKWFKINKEGAFYPEFITSLPDNFTMEFDLGVNEKFSFYSTPLMLTFNNMARPSDEFSWWGAFPRWNGKHALRMEIHPNDASGQKGSSRLITSIDGNHLMNNSVAVNEFNNREKNFIHVSIWRQKQRFRAYVGNEKIWDLPRAFAEGATYNSFVLGTGAFQVPEDFYVVNNLRLAVGAPDTRSKLITEGKFVTRGILFDVNSDQIKPESYGTIKDIANVLNENGSVKVRIIGHTDSDGDDKSNLELSKRRAASVKEALTKEFGIDGGRIETDGKGESQPVDKGTTDLAKANNRRVEFVKL